MYPCTFKEKFPCGRGYEWTLKKNVMEKRLLVDDKISHDSVEWFDYMQFDNRLVDKKGKRCRLISGWNSREVKIGPYIVDGYSQVDEKTYIFEFNGCFFHGCPICKYEPKSVC